MSQTKTKIMENFYDYHCNSCEATYTSNEEETECFYCGKPTLVIQVKRPNIVRVRKKTPREELDAALDSMSEPDYDWDYEISKRR